MQRKGFVLLLFALAVSAATVFAHHGSAVSYDLSRKVTVHGTIIEFKYINPHPALFWDVKDDQGNITHWTGEIAPNVAQLQQNGWGRKRSEAALAAGTPVTITLSPSRAGGPVGLVKKIESGTGEAILGEIGLGAGAPPPAEPKQ